MPVKDYNNYMKIYMSERYRTRRIELIIRLGDSCVKCGSTTNLELDHINPKDKIINWKYLAGLAKDKLESEILKCQLLCKACHIIKTVEERGQTLARGTHGTLSARRFCGPPTCQSCRNVYNEWTRNHRKSRAGNSEARVSLS